MIKVFIFISSFLILTGSSFAVIETQEIAGINPETIGVAQADSTFIPDNLWQGLSHEQVVHLIKKLPSNFRNRFWEDLQISLLTAAMKIPPSQSDEENILNVRFKKLLQMEAIDQAYNLGKKHIDLLKEDDWAWCRFLHFLIHNNYDKAFSIAQECALKSKDNKWQYAVITMQLLMGKDDQAKFSVSLLEKQRLKRDHHFIESIKQIQSGEKVKNIETLTRPLIMKLMISKNNVPEGMAIESLSYGMVLLMILDPGFEKFSDRMQLSILEYCVEGNKVHTALLKKKYCELVSKEHLKNVAEKMQRQEYDTENDPLVRAAYYKLFEEAENEELQKAAFQAYYVNAYKNKILPVAVACFGKEFNFPASNYDERYAFSFLLHNMMLKNIEGIETWLEKLTDKDLAELALMIMVSIDLEKLSEETKKTLIEEIRKIKFDTPKSFLYQSKFNFINLTVSHSIKTTDSRLFDLVAGYYNFGEALCIIFRAAEKIIETDVWQTGVLARSLRTIGLSDHVNSLLQFHAYPSSTE
jgi:hypothetical protein